MEHPIDWQNTIDWLYQEFNKDFIEFKNRFETISIKKNIHRGNTDTIKIPIHKKEQIKKSLEDFLSNTSHIGRFDLLEEWSLHLLSRLTTESIKTRSLHDELKVKIATTFTEYRYGESNLKTKKLRIVLGDVSGIQNYLFAIAHTGIGSVAKQLRARSFNLSMLPKLAALYILEQFGLTYRHVFMVTGGIFLLCVREEDDLANINTKLSQHIYEDYHGKLQLHLADQLVSYNQIYQIDQIFMELHSKIRRSKQNPMRNLFQREGRWSKDIWMHEMEIGEYCKNCRQNATVDQKTSLCIHCLRDMRLGQILPTCIGMQVKRASVYAEQNYWGKYEISFITDIEQISEDAVYTEIWNEDNIKKTNLASRCKEWVKSVYVSNYVPKNTLGDVATFEEITQKSKGAKKLGVFKADLDNLGILISAGLSNEQDSYALADYLNVSRTLEQFIGQQLTSIAVTKYPNVYTVFSGGDDIFILAPWSDVLKFSLDIKQSFDQFTNYNPNITISAGIVIARKKTPISLLAEQADEALSLAKEEPCFYSNREYGRNQVCISNTLVEWENISDIEQLAEQWEKWEKRGQASHQTFRKLVELSKMKRNYHEYGRIEGLKYHSKLSYMINRLNSKKNIELINWLEELYESRLEENTHMYKVWNLIPVIYEMYSYLREGWVKDE